MNQRYRYLIGFFIVILMVFSAGPLQAQTTNPSTTALETFWLSNLRYIFPTDQARYTLSVRAKAQVDECFYGYGDPNWTANLDSYWVANLTSFKSRYPGNFSAADIANCVNSQMNGFPGHPKVNQAYVWGLTEGTAGDLWFGTIANTLCLVFNGFYAGFIDPIQNSSWECEMMSKNRPTGDARPPRIFLYNIYTRALMDMTPSIIASKRATDIALLQSTYGLRSAGSAKGVVFLGGLGLDPKTLASTVNIFAFNAYTHAYLGAVSMPQYSNIRQWIVVNGELYTGVASSTGGTILHWIGSAANPFKFEIVGNIGGDPAYLAFHENHIVASTWGLGSSSLNGGGMGLFISRSLPYWGKLGPADANSWTEVWDLSKYEVEPTAPQVAGAIASYGGWLYFSTMHVPGTGVLSFYETYHQMPDTATFLGTYRPIVLFRAKNLGTPQQQVQLLYGTSTLPKYNTGTGQWDLVPNNLNQAPLYGPAGFGNFFNNYTWWMQVYNNQLYVGTMDWSYLDGVLSSSNSNLSDYFPALPPALIQMQYGADLWHFSSATRAATPVSYNGVTNNLNYGIRTMVVSGGSLYLGSANPMNMATTPQKPNGGWELIQMR